MSTPQQLLAEIDTFLKNHRMSATAFGKTAMADPGFVHDLRKGREPRQSVVERARQFIRERQDEALGR